MNRIELLSKMETARFECPDIDCGAIFSYGRTSCGGFVLPAFCPTCGGAMDALGETDDTGLIIDMVAEYPSMGSSDDQRLIGECRPFPG
jgi:hypothetical protein